MTLPPNFFLGHPQLPEVPRVKGSKTFQSPGEWLDEWQNRAVAVGPIEGDVALSLCMSKQPIEQFRSMQMLACFLTPSTARAVAARLIEAAGLAEAAARVEPRPVAEPHE